MCGIAGFLNSRNNDKKTEKEIYQILKKMNEVQRHRGPDDEGIFLFFCNGYITGDIFGKWLCIRACTIVNP